MTEFTTPLDPDELKLAAGSTTTEAVKRVKAASRRKSEVWEQPYAEARGVVVAPADLRTLLSALDQSAQALGESWSEVMCEEDDERITFRAIRHGGRKSRAWYVEAHRLVCIDTDMDGESSAEFLDFTQKAVSAADSRATEAERQRDEAVARAEMAELCIAAVRAKARITAQMAKGAEAQWWRRLDDEIDAALSSSGGQGNG